MDSLRKTEEPVEIFRMVFRSLESHRPVKAEQDLIDQIRSRYGLGADRKKWPDELIQKRVSAEEFLKYTLNLLAPFVEMIIDLYEFLYAYASTAGGKTQHFLIDSEDLSTPWSFDVSRLPKEIRWISAWADTRIEEVAIDWETIGKCLLIDNGIFYGSVENKRLIQSLIIARRDGGIDSNLMELGNRIYETIRRALRAWYSEAARRLRNDGHDLPENPRFRAYLPWIFKDRHPDDTYTRGQSNYIGVDLDLALNSEPGSYAAAEVFHDPDPSSDIDQLLPDAERNWPVHAAVAFCAMWGLEEPSFRRIALLHRSHEERNDLLFGQDLVDLGARLGELVLQRLTQAIQPTGNVTQTRELMKQRLEIVLLPYWKDRWFLFEMWTLIQVLRRGLRVGAHLALEGVTKVPDPNISGTVWQLPTQKAKTPVATVSSPEDTVLVWFQRETRRLDSENNMEPDIRLTSNEEPYPDLAIVECKDRIKFAGAKSDAVVSSYLRGSGARLVWLVNYEKDQAAGSRTGIANGQSFGIAQRFRPHAIPPDFRASLEQLIREHLKLQTADRASASDLSYLVIDNSGSMDGKTLPDSEIVREFAPKGHEFVKLWSYAVRNVDAETWQALSSRESEIHGTEVENGKALENFARKLPQGARLIVITDSGGLADLLGNGAMKESHPSDSRYLYSLGGRPLQIITV